MSMLFFSLLCNLQIWIVLGPEGRADFEKRFPERAAKAKFEFESYTRGLDSVLTLHQAYIQPNCFGVQWNFAANLVRRAYV